MFIGITGIEVVLFIVAVLAAIIWMAITLIKKLFEAFEDSNLSFWMLALISIILGVVAFVIRRYYIINGGFPFLKSVNLLEFLAWFLIIFFVICLIGLICFGIFKFVTWLIDLRNKRIEQQRQRQWMLQEAPVYLKQMGIPLQPYSAELVFANLVKGRNYWEISQEIIDHIDPLLPSEVQRNHYAKATVRNKVVRCLLAQQGIYTEPVHDSSGLPLRLKIFNNKY